MSVIEVHGVSKRYRKDLQPLFHMSLKTFFLDGFRQKLQEPAALVWALQDVDFKVAKGTTLGIIGRNGSGKSTLLRLMAGILKPDTGSIEIRGPVAPLIELGAGFHHEMTARDNIIVNGMILGLSKNTIKARVDTIIDFAELRHVLDDPIRTFSTGMVMRLGFSVAIHVDPEILIMDEILAVGDVAFRRKCFERLELFKHDGKTMVVVSHDLNLVRSWCDEAMWLEAGIMKIFGHPGDVVDAYLRECG